MFRCYFQIKKQLQLTIQVKNIIKKIKTNRLEPSEIIFPIDEIVNRLEREKAVAHLRLNIVTEYLKNINCENKNDTLIRINGAYKQSLSVLVNEFRQSYKLFLDSKINFCNGKEFNKIEKEKFLQEFDKEIKNYANFFYLPDKELLDLSRELEDIFHEIDGYLGYFSSQRQIFCGLLTNFNEFKKNISEAKIFYEAQLQQIKNNFSKLVSLGELETIQELGEEKYLKRDNINKWDEKSGKNFLHIACENGHLELISFLLKKGAYTNKASKCGLFPLHFAMKHKGENLSAIVELLITYKCPVMAKGKEDITPLHVAAAYGNKGGIELLLEKGISIDAQDTTNSTPLHYAAISGDYLVVQQLLKAGANVLICNKEGLTPMGEALLHRHFKAAQVFFKWGCWVSTQQLNYLINKAQDGCDLVVDISKFLSQEANSLPQLVTLKVEEVKSEAPFSYRGSSITQFASSNNNNNYSNNSVSISKIFLTPK